jgi:RNA polymerase sigma-70 factor (ECF subfamily)
METTGEREGCTYCLVARDSAEVAELLSESWGAANEIPILVERRWRERRVRARRQPTPGRENRRRVVRSVTGRRVAERRGRLLVVRGPRLPAVLVAAAASVTFVRYEPLSARGRQNAESLRLVVRVQAGDPAAFGELYALWAGPLLSYFERALRDRHAAEDAVQETSRSLLGELRDYEIRLELPFEPWLFRIAYSRLVDEARRRRRLEVWEPGELTAQREREGRIPDVADRDERGALDGLLGRVRLPESQRQVLTLRFAFDLSLAETAQALGISERAARQLQYRALRTLRQRFSEPGAARGALRMAMRRRDPQPPVLSARRLALLGP